MSKKALWCFFVIGMCFAQVGYAAGRLHVEFRYPSNERGVRTDGGGGLVEFVMTNTGDGPVELDALDAPKTMDGRLANNVLDIVDGNGNEAPYMGRYVSLYDKMPTYVTRVAPLQTVVYRLDLGKDYRLESGRIYTVKLNRTIKYSTSPPKAYGPQSLQAISRSLAKAEANSILVWIDPRKQTSPSVGDRASASVIDGNSTVSAEACSTEQTTAFNQAKQKALALVEEGSNYLANLYTYEIVGQEVILHFNQTPRYLKWFGVHANPVSSTNPDPNDSYVDEGAYLIYARLLGDPSLPGATMPVSCLCKPDEEENGALAAVDKTAPPYKIYLCTNFFQVPLMPVLPDYNSQAGTIIHETSHFTDAYWNGTEDHVRGPTDVKALVISNRNLAVRTADAYKYFYLNVESDN